MLPGLVEGKPPLLLALVGSTVIMIGVLYFAHGFSARTSTALLGTIFGLGITALLAAWATDAANLAGVGSHDAATLVNISDQHLHLRHHPVRTHHLRARRPQRRHHHPVLRRLGTVRTRPGHERPQAVHLGHADRPGPHRLHRLHHCLRLCRRRPAHPDHRDALRPSAGRGPDQRRTVRGSHPHAGRLHRAGPGDSGHHADRRAGGQGHRRPAGGIKPRRSDRCSPAAGAGRRNGRRRRRHRRARGRRGGGAGRATVPTPARRRRPAAGRRAAARGTEVTLSTYPTRIRPDLPDFETMDG